MGESSARSNAAYGKTANQVGDTNDESNCENVVCSEFSILPSDSVTLQVRVDLSEFVLEDDSNNDTIDGNSLAENN